MGNATIDITGIGPVEIKTNREEITLVGALTVTGDPANCKTKKVRRNKKDAKKAAQNFSFWLREVKPGYFMLMEADI